MSLYALLLIATAAAVCFKTSRGHGSLNEPPSRASAWRHGFDTEPDYDDDGAYCGGFAVHWDLNGGHCGICGDAWHLPEPRPHELGGKYGTGVLVRTYAPGDLIPVTVNLTTSHRGFWVLKLCPDANENSQECFERLTLQQADGASEFYPDISRVYQQMYRLPTGVTCERCVIQWTYTAGNNWGQCEDGTSALGCGRQETFRACADISIQTSSETTNNYNMEPDQTLFAYADAFLNDLYDTENQPARGQHSISVEDQPLVSAIFIDSKASGANELGYQHSYLEDYSDKL